MSRSDLRKCRASSSLLRFGRFAADPPYATLLIEEEFLGVDQGPDQVFIPLAELPFDPSAGEVCNANLALICGWQPRVAKAIELVDLLRLGPDVRGPARGPALLVIELSLDLGRVQQVKTLR